MWTRRHTDVYRGTYAHRLQTHAYKHVHMHTHWFKHMQTGKHTNLSIETNTHPDPIAHSYITMYTHSSYTLIYTQTNKNVRSQIHTHIYIDTNSCIQTPRH